MMTSGSAQRLIDLATLSDSLDYLADAMQHFGDGQHARQLPLVRPLALPAPSQTSAPHRLL